MRYSSELFFHINRPSVGGYTAFGVNRLALESQEFGGQDVDPLEGRAVGKPWSVDLVDFSTSVTSILADSSGRTELIGQRGILAETTAGTYPLIGSTDFWNAAGRISDIMLLPDQTYRIVMEDALLRLRSAPIFVKNTTSNGSQLYPPGLMGHWGRFTARGGVPGRVVSTFVNLSEIQIPLVTPLSRDIVDAIMNDYEGVYDGTNASTGDGNFRHLRLNVNGADYPVYGFGGFAPYGIGTHLSVFERDVSEHTELRVWVTGLSVSTTGTNEGVDAGDCILHMTSGPPSAVNPIHIGTSAGINPFQLLKNILNGNYGSSSLMPTYSTHLTDLINDKSFPLTWFRITEPQRMVEWVEENICKPYGAILFTDAHAEDSVVPQTIFLPDPDNHPSASLFEFTSTNLREAPTWIQSKRTICTVTQTTIERVSEITPTRAKALGYSFPADALEINSFTTEFVHDRASNLGRHVREIYLGVAAGNSIASVYQERLAREMFERYGDGAIWGEIQGVSTEGSTGVHDVTPGDFVKINLSVYPNVGIQGRGGTRVVQIMSRAETPVGPVFEYLDAAEDPPTITAPTLTAANSTRNPRHALTITLGGLSTATSSGPAAGWEIEVANSASTLAINSTLWELRSAARQPRSTDPWYISSGTFDITELKSGSTYFVRARFGLYQGYHSAWTYTTAGVGTSQLAGPSGLAATGHTISTIDFSWTNATASTGYPLEVRHSTFGGTLARTQVLQPGMTRYRLDGLSSGTTYTFDARYYDTYGGVSPSTSMSTETTGTSTSAPALQSFYLRWGRSSTTPAGLMY